MATKTFDPKCLTLAEDFLDDHPDLYDKAKGLAEEIQDTIESWIEWESKRGERVAREVKKLEQMEAPKLPKEGTRNVGLTYREVQQLRIGGDMLHEACEDGNELPPSSLVSALGKLKNILA